MENNYIVTLASSLDVKDASPDSISVETNRICMLLYQVEESLFNECLGYNFYCDLLDDKLKVESCIWSYNEDYSSEQYVIDPKTGHCYKSLKDVPKSTQLKNKEFWCKADKFNKPLYNQLWYKYLRSLIAFAVFNEEIVFSAIRSTNIGIVSNNGEFSDSASVKQLDILKRSSSNFNTGKTLQNMHAFLMRHKDEKCFENYSGFPKDCEPSKGCHKKSSNCGFIINNEPTSNRNSSFRSRNRW